MILQCVGLAWPQHAPFGTAFYELVLKGTPFPSQDGITKEGQQVYVPFGVVLEETNEFSGY